MYGKVIAALIACAGLAFAVPARAADTVQIGSVDATSANRWPLHIAAKNGYFDDANLKIDLVFAHMAPLYAILVVLCFGAMHVTFDYVITPRVVGGSVGLHPLVNVFALMCGATIFGVWGMLLAVPVAASIQMLLVYFFPKLAEKPILATLPTASTTTPPDELAWEEETAAAPMK